MSGLRSGLVILFKICPDKISGLWPNFSEYVRKRSGLPDFLAQICPDRDQACPPIFGGPTFD
jgi:hypothetical protein